MTKFEEARAELPPPPPNAAAAIAPVKAVKQDINADSPDDCNDQMDTPAPPAAAVSKQKPKKPSRAKLLERCWRCSGRVLTD